MSNLRAVQPALDAYHIRYRNPKLNSLLASKPYALFPDTESVAHVGLAGRWPDYWPNGGCPGVYLFLDTDLDVLYVGKTSLTQTLIPASLIGSGTKRTEDVRSEGSGTAGQRTLSPSLFRPLLRHLPWRNTCFNNFIPPTTWWAASPIRQQGPRRRLAPIANSKNRPPLPNCWIIVSG